MEEYEKMLEEIRNVVKKAYEAVEAFFDPIEKIGTLQYTWVRNRNGNKYYYWYVKNGYGTSIFLGKLGLSKEEIETMKHIRGMAYHVFNAISTVENYLKLVKKVDFQKIKRLEPYIMARIEQKAKKEVEVEE